ncbi:MULTISPECIES: hypothetical protein [Actinomycetes]|uniref:hypothetical protein n=1 Tax=Actinomycetes TaxID=1760 RepID=UPI0001B55177|nr:MULTISPECIES: hypothetical protein [Actinomycetes]
MNPAFVSALISVVTATVVTLAIEFAAKPRLEARKDPESCPRIGRFARCAQTSLSWATS